MRFLHVGWFAVAALTAAACNGQVSATCVQGQAIACAGPGGCSGYQVCNSSGDYGACICGAPDDSGPSIDSSIDSGTTLPLPPECASPGPFTDATMQNISTLFVGTWIYCDSPVWVGASSVDPANVGIEIRADGTWQNLAWSGSQLVGMTKYTDKGAWTYYGGGCCGPMELLSSNYSADGAPSGGLAMNASFGPAQRSMHVSTAAGGHESILAKAVGTQ